MQEIPKTLAELKLEEEVGLLKRELTELRWQFGLMRDAPVMGLSTKNPIEVPALAFNIGELRLAVGAEYKKSDRGVQYYGYVKQPDSYRIGVWTDTSQNWGMAGALHHLDHLNQSIQGELLKALNSCS